MANPKLRIVGACACVLVVWLVALPLHDWLYRAVLSRSPKELVLHLNDLEFPALYKKALRNSDGSLDLCINIPASADVLQRLHSRQEEMKRNLAEHPISAMNEIQNGNNTKTAKEDKKDQKSRGPKTHYPLTLDSPYLINSPELCKGVHPLHFLVIVHTSTVHFQRRRLLRETWANKNVMTTRNLRLLFVLGLPDHHDTSTQLLIENEWAVYRDLIQGRFHDSYQNLTHKGVLAYRWIHQYCPHAHLILKVDDDVFINPFLLYEIYYPRFSHASRTMACYTRPINTNPILRNKSKWVVPEDQFRGYKFYPVINCNGFVVIITPDIIKALYKAAYITPFFWVDDVYLFGILPFKVGEVKHVNIRENTTLMTSVALKCYQKTKCSLLASAVQNEIAMEELWRLSLTQISPSIKRHINPVYLIT